MNNSFGKLQKLGKAFMLPIAVLPVASLFFRLGAKDLLNIPFIYSIGNAIFENLPIIFAIGLAVGLAKENHGAAGLAGAISYFVLTYGLESLIEDPQMGVLAGIITGILAGYSYNKFRSTKLPSWLGFFGGKRFVPIVCAFFSMILALIFSIIWPPIQNVIDIVGTWIAHSGTIGAFVYGTLNRLLIPTGLHHILNNLVWVVFGDYNGVTGDIQRFIAGDPSAGLFMTGYFPVMMFGLPGAALAMYTTSKRKNKNAISGALFSVAFTAFLTGVTEPLEFLFMFLAPILYIGHAILTGLSMAITYALGMRLGFAFSAGLFDYALNFNIATKPLLLIVVGAVTFFIYYFFFVFVIKKFDLPTPGRIDEAKEQTDDIIKDEGLAGLAAKYTIALGGADNISEIDACITRLRLNVIDSSIIKDSDLKKLGAAGVMRLNKNSIQVVVGTQAELIADEMKKVVKKKSTILYVPTDCEVVKMEDVPDKTFSEKMIGDGVAFIPYDGKIKAPADGTIIQIFPTNHAFSLDINGFEILIHLGIDTVQLKGKGFKRIAEEGQQVKRGDTIIELDLDYIKEQNKSLVCPIIITNMDIVSDMKAHQVGSRTLEGPILEIWK